MDETQARLGTLEQNFTDVRVDIAQIKSDVAHSATKDDLSRLESTLIKWTLVTIVAVAGLVFAIAKAFH